MNLNYIYFKFEFHLFEIWLHLFVNYLVCFSHMISKLCPGHSWRSWTRSGWLRSATLLTVAFKLSKSFVAVVAVALSSPVEVICFRRNYVVKLPPIGAALFEDAGLIHNCMTGLSGFEAGSFGSCIIAAAVGIAMKTCHSRQSFALSLVILVPQIGSICARNVGKKKPWKTCHLFNDHDDVAFAHFPMFDVVFNVLWHYW